MPLIRGAIELLALLTILFVIWVSRRRKIVFSLLILAGATVAIVAFRRMHLGHISTALDIILPILSDFVPIAIATVGIIMSYKQPKRESHLLTTVILLTAGFVGTGVLSWTRIRNDSSHRSEMKGLNDKITLVGGNTSDLLRAFVAWQTSIAPQDPQSVLRKRAIIATLRNEYILSHDNISPGILSGNEYPPEEWINKRLRDLGEKWQVEDIRPLIHVTPTHPTPQPAQPKARLGLWFWRDVDPKEIGILVYNDATRPVVDGKVHIELFVSNYSPVTARHGSYMIRLAPFTMKLVADPEGQGIMPKSPSAVPSERHFSFDVIQIMARTEKITFDAIPEPGMSAFNIEFRYECETCEDVMSPQYLTVRIGSPASFNVPKQPRQ